MKLKSAALVFVIFIFSIAFYFYSKKVDWCKEAKKIKSEQISKLDLLLGLPRGQGRDGGLIYKEYLKDGIRIRAFIQKDQDLGDLVTDVYCENQ